MIDILKQLYQKKITEDRAYDIKDKASMDFHIGNLKEYPYVYLNLDNYERTAASNCDLSRIAKWRYEGWPEKCPKCGKKIIKEKFGWHCNEVNEKEHLVHIDCSDEYLKSIGYTDDDLKIG